MEPILKESSLLAMVTVKNTFLHIPGAPPGARRRCQSLPVAARRGAGEPAAADPTTIPPSKEIPAGGHRRNRLSKKRRDRVKRRCVMETRVLKWPDEEVLPL
mmetsp:Transcript_91345/g.255134  ORF Transcript_91345/g.255134 Transcript_91345/m.255134 type:complete len:102 (-) Transcript_91345:402-707(-)